MHKRLKLSANTASFNPGFLVLQNGSSENPKRLLYSDLVTQPFKDRPMVDKYGGESEREGKGKGELDREDRGALGYYVLIPQPYK